MDSEVSGFASWVEPEDCFCSTTATSVTETTSAVVSPLQVSVTPASEISVIVATAVLSPVSPLALWRLALTCIPTFKFFSAAARLTLTTGRPWLSACSAGSVSKSCRQSPCFFFLARSRERLRKQSTPLRFQGLTQLGFQFYLLC